MRAGSVRRRSAFAAAGRCVQCGKPRDVGSDKYCAEHILKLAAYRWLDDVRKWRELRDLLASQGGRCAYTNEKLVLGVNASIDHKTPRSRGGSNTIGNVHWVTWAVNRCKTDLTHDEFVAMCRTVACQAEMDKVFQRVPHRQIPVRGEVA